MKMVMPARITPATIVRCGDHRTADGQGREDAASVDGVSLNAL